MIPYDAVAGYSALLGQVRAAGVADLDRLAASLAGLSVAEQYDALVELLPDLGQRYEVAASKVTAEFFSELQQMQGVRRPVSPVELDPVSRASWQALAGWSTSGKTLAEQTANDVFFGLLSGGFTRRLTEAASDTMAENAAVQGGMRWQRVPAPGCCAFCAMLASRGGSYTSRESATKVVGRGQSVEYRRRGGAKETRPRGSQKLGQTFHDNCVVPGTMVSGPPSQVGYRRYYEGKIITLVTSLGYELSITPKHPVLTDRGWVDAGELDIGDQLVSSVRRDRNVVGGPYVDHVPARIEDVVRTLSMVPSSVRRSVPGSSEQFHGDGFDSEVDVVLGNDLFGDEVNPSLVQPFSKLDLHRAAVAIADERLLSASFGKGNQAFLGSSRASHGIVSGRGQGATLCATHAAHADLVGFRAGAGLNSGLLEPSDNCRARDAVVLGHGEDAFAGAVPTGEVRGGLNTVPRKFDPTVADGSVERSSVYAELGCDLRDRLAGSVGLDRVVDVRVSDYQGDVLNLETSEGWYSANGITVSNCRCSAVAVAEGNEVDLGAQAKKYFKAYADARDEVLSKVRMETDVWMGRDKSRHTDSYRVDENDDRVSSKELTNRMAALMRKAAA